MIKPGETLTVFVGEGTGNYVLISGDGAVEIHQKKASKERDVGVYTLYKKEE
jgi:hypothetical protein